MEVDVTSKSSRPVSDDSALDASAPPKPGAGTIVLLGVVTALPALSIDMYLPGLPALSASLNAAPGAAEITVVTFLTGLGIGNLLHGPLSDRVGRRWVLIPALAIYAVVSALCVVTFAIEQLIVFRFFQGFAGSAGAVVARAIVVDRFPPKDAVHIFSLMMLVSGLAPMLAPLLGGVILEFTSWRVVFVVLTVIGCCASATVYWFLPESRSPEVAARARSEHTVRSYLEVFRNRDVLRFSLTGAFGSAVLFIYISSAPDVFITQLGLTPVGFSMIFAANALAMMAAAQGNRFLLRKYSSEQILRGGNMCGVLAAAVLLWLVLFRPASAFGVEGLLIFILALRGIATPNANAEAMAAARDRSGTTSAMVGFSMYAISALMATVTAGLHDGTARPMALMMLAALVAAAVALHWKAPLRPDQT